jgi:hypothetical protein
VIAEFPELFREVLGFGVLLELNVKVCQRHRSSSSDILPERLVRGKWLEKTARTHQVRPRKEQIPLGRMR